MKGGVERERERERKAEAKIQGTVGKDEEEKEQGAR